MHKKHALLHTRRRVIYVSHLSTVRGIGMFNSKSFVYLAAIQVFVWTPASSVLTDPGPLCVGQSATLTCNITGGTGLEWNYAEAGGIRMRVAIYSPTSDPSGPITVEGVEFTVSLLMPTSPHFVSEISFQASTMMNGGVLSCSAVVPMIVDEQISLQVINTPGPPGNVRLSDFMNGTNTSDVTIQWTPPSEESMMYTIVITPLPVSGVVMDTNNTEVSVTLLYNTPYTTSVSTSTPCPGPPQNISFTLVTCEFPVDVSGDVMLPISGPAQTLYPEGSEIMYQCRPGFQPNRTIIASCGTERRWTPDPARHNCIVDCGSPVLPSNANGAVTNTTEGSIVNFQCDEGFVLSGQDTTQIQCTRVSDTGQWIPNPTMLLCIVECSDLVLPSNTNGSIGEVTSTTEGSTVNFQCEEELFLPSGQSNTIIQCMNNNSMGQWIPDPDTLLCGPGGSLMTTSESVSTSSTDSTSSPGERETESGTTEKSTFSESIIISVVVVLAAALIILIAVVILIVIYVKRKQVGTAAKKGGKEHNGLELHEATPEHKAEYHTLQSRGYNADQAEYSTVHHNHHVNKTYGGEEYSEVKADTKLKNVRKANVPAGSVSEYNQLNTNPAGDVSEYSQLNNSPDEYSALHHDHHVNKTPSGDVSEYNQLNTNPAPPDPSSNLVYADLSIAMPQKKKKKKPEAAAAAPVPDQDKVVYGAIDPKATAALKKKMDAARIPPCDLDMMLIQVKKEVAPLWYEYGVVLALPKKVLKDIKDLEMDDNDKLVEVLDYWFRKFPPGAGPTWKEVALSVREIGLATLADKLIKVDTTGELPIEVSTRVEVLEVKDPTPPPVPPKMDSDQDARLPPPHTGSLKQQPPPRPPKAGTQTLPAATPCPPKTQPSHLPARPPKPGLT